MMVIVIKPKRQQSNYQKLTETPRKRKILTTYYFIIREWNFVPGLMCDFCNKCLSCFIENWGEKVTETPTDGYLIYVRIT